MANYPQELAQDAVCQSNTGHMTVLWFLPTRPLRLNTNEWMRKENCTLQFRTSSWVYSAVRNVQVCSSPSTFQQSCASKLFTAGRDVAGDKQHETKRVLSDVIPIPPTSCCPYHNLSFPPPPPLLTTPNLAFRAVGLTLHTASNPGMINS